MSTINEQIVTGRAHRVLIDKAAKLWQRISFWTKASDVEFNDKKTAETKVGAIDGITDSLASTSSRIAASAKSVNKLSNDLGGFKPIIDSSTGRITGYKTQAGADTVFPFSSGNAIYLGENSNINVKSFIELNNIPVDFTKLTSANFKSFAVKYRSEYACNADGVHIDPNQTGSSGVSYVTHSYNNNTGILTISPNVATTVIIKGTGSCYVTARPIIAASILILP